MAMSVNMFRFRLTTERQAALEERPAGPEDNRRGEQELKPIGGALAEKVVQPYE